MNAMPYLDPSLPIETRVADLLTHMNLTEKCAQLIGPFGLDEGDGQLSLPVWTQVKLYHFYSLSGLIPRRLRRRKGFGACPEVDTFHFS